MYVLRALTVSLSMFVLVCVAVFVAVRCGWTFFGGRDDRVRHPRWTNLLLAVQLAPVLVASLVVAFFALPSFLRFEPRAADEDFGVAATVLAAFGVAFLIIGIVRGIRSLHRTRDVTAAWSGQPCKLHDHQGVTAYHVHTPGVLAVTGVSRQKLFISPEIAQTLTSEELARAVAHEMVHIRRRDNLAKLAVVLCRVPGMKQIESAWLDAVEMTADQRAVSTKAEALDLASALVKVSRLRTQPLPDLALGFAANANAALSARVERLLTYEAPTFDRRSPRIVWCGLTMLGTLALTAFAYQPILLQMHAFTEWLVR
jgi:hypothetical protein